ncbi:MAG: hypothetical protein J0665_18485 [Deltaproteobacteria bacterium]|nr:hypothetical protein [Deltaproteobacteria bacterium]
MDLTRSFSDYMIGRYRLGYDYLAVYIAAILFEHIVDTKYLPHSNCDDGCTLGVILNNISDLSVFSDDVICNNHDQFHVLLRKNNGEIVKRGTPIPLESTLLGVKKKLLDFVLLRNKIMHEFRPDVLSGFEQEIVELIVYVSSTIQGVTTISSEDKHKILHIGEITADYMIKEVDEIMMREKDKKLIAKEKDEYFVGSDQIKEADFESLFSLRKKMYFLKNDLDRWLPSKFPNLHTTILTPIDTTSGYIWMPLVHNFKELEEKERPALFEASVSILATPLELRVYMDFGGYALDLRRKYHEFLLAEKGGFIDSIGKISSDELLVFDTTWYSYISSYPVKAIDFVCEGDYFNTVDSKLKAKPILPSKGNKIITWNKMLSGYILPRADIDKQAIYYKLESIIQLYYDFLEFVYPGRCNIKTPNQ